MEALSKTSMPTFSVSGGLASNYVGAEINTGIGNTTVAIDYNNLSILPQVRGAAHFDLSEYKVGPYINFMLGTNKNKNVSDLVSTNVKNQYEVGMAVQRNFAEKLDLTGKIGYAGAKTVVTGGVSQDAKIHGTAMGIGAIYDWQDNVKFITDYTFTKYKDLNAAKKLRAYTSSVSMTYAF